MGQCFFAELVQIYVLVGALLGQNTRTHHYQDKDAPLICRSQTAHFITSDLLLSVGRMTSIHNCKYSGIFYSILTLL